jgi:hypothetical protein
MTASGVAFPHPFGDCAFVRSHAVFTSTSLLCALLSRRRLSAAMSHVSSPSPRVTRLYTMTGFTCRCRQQRASICRSTYGFHTRLKITTVSARWRFTPTAP